MSTSSCAPPGRNCAIFSTGIGIATPPTWTPGAGDGDGEAKGIGFEVVRQLARKGFRVFLGARSEKAGLAAAEKLNKEIDKEKTKL